jgi:putative ABC transport system permease protein
MLRFRYLFRNITRNLLRAMLTCLAVALPIVIFVLASAVIDGINRFLDNSAKQLRLAITHRSSIVNPLPSGHRLKIESLDPTHEHLLGVCGMTWIGGKLEDDPRPLSTLASDADTFPMAFPEHLRGPGERDAWMRDRQAIVVGRGTAQQFGWKLGDKITITSSLPPYKPMEFNIVSSPPAEDVADAVTNFCRRDYVVEENKRNGWDHDNVSFFFVRCASLADIANFRQKIDSLFANSPDPTETQDEKSFMNQFISQQFDLPRNLKILSTLTVLIAILAATNTMSMSFRDRLSEYATLRAMGFKPSAINFMIGSESLSLCLIGGLFGALGPYIAFMHTRLGDYRVPVIEHLEIHPQVCMYAIAIAAGIGVIAAAWPCWLAMRLKVVEAFRILE